MRLSRFSKFTWFVLGFNVLVVVWGVFLRASKSGDGCGKYWLTCHGEVIPSAPEFKTIIEFSHRVMSGLDVFLVLGLLIVILVYFKGDKQLKLFAILSFVFIVTEALIGAGLVLTGNVAETHTATRPLWAVGHLINTFLLLGSLAITAWLASGGNKFINLRNKKLVWIAVAGTIAICFVGVTGSIASLTNMLFPSESVIEGIKKDFAPDSNYLLRIRILHPFGAVAASVLLGFIAAWLKSKHEDSRAVVVLSGLVSVFVLLQVIVGAMTLLTGAPIIMQLIHLLLADGVWIAWVLMIAACFGYVKNESADSGILQESD
jgi:heme A synthase